MTDLISIVGSGGAKPWIYLPAAVLLGALHGLEPGHSKTLMAAFIVAIRGTVKQAALLGLAATISHTIVVWVVALGGMWMLQGRQAGALEPYFQLASGGVIASIALWMLWQAWQSQRRGRSHHSDNHHHDGDHRHRHDEPTASDLVPSLQAAHAHSRAHTHDHVNGMPDTLELVRDADLDDHARAHAAGIRRHFVGRTATTGQIVLFGLTGGLVPCAAAVTVLLLCLQLKKIALGAVLVLSFSIGLAITLVVVGAAAALGVRQASRRWSWLSSLANRAPYFSGLLILATGVYMGLSGWFGLA
jgi:nickel/cobalt transporter (NicO) family protein